MLKGLRAAETAMNIQLNRTNVLANNLANVDTAGFKRVLTQVAEAGLGQGPDGGDQDLRAPGGRGLDVRSPVDMSSGTLRETGRTLDVAVQGEGFFKVVREGRTYYTRNGSFSLDAERRLTTPDGAQVQGAGGPITVPEGEVVVREDGMVLVDGAELDRLAVAAFDAPERLQHVGGSNFKAPVDLPARTLGVEDVRLAQGMLENSNASPIDTMIAMIAAQRAFELEAKVLQASDRTLDKSVNELARKA